VEVGWNRFTALHNIVLSIEVDRPILVAAVAGNKRGKLSTGQTVLTDVMTSLSMDAARSGCRCHAVGYCWPDRLLCCGQWCADLRLERLTSAASLETSVGVASVLCNSWWGHIPTSNIVQAPLVTYHSSSATWLLCPLSTDQHAFWSCEHMCA